MARDSDHPETEQDESTAPSEQGESLARASGPDGEGAADGEPTDEDPEAGHIGVQRYVHASFFALAILAAYLTGNVLLSAWNSLAEIPDAVRNLPFLIEYSEEERGSLTLVIGAVVGVLLVLRYYRRPAVRSWATQVAGELARVTWPSKETVTNGTIVVLVAGALATLYIALLDRLWGYLTNIIYGA